MNLNFWSELVTVALVGTERQNFQLPENLQDQLSQFLAKLNYPESESLILTTAGVFYLYQKTGKKINTYSDNLPDVCDLDELPSFQEQGQQYLNLLLKSEHHSILPEFLQLLAKSRQRIPDNYLVDCLELGKNKPEIRPFLLPVLGKRGYWLAAQNREWDYIITNIDLSLWETGSIEARQAILQQLRQENPEEARELLSKNWQQETADNRVKFVAILATNLSINDEPFLETLLDDRSKKVRQITANLLAKLPESSFYQRQLKRLESLLIFNNQPQISLTVNLPQAWDAAMQRDGIEVKPPNQEAEKAWWLTQIIATIMPSYWCEIWKTTPQQLLELIKGKPWEGILFKAWVNAAELHQDLAWIETILETNLSKLNEEQILNLFQILSQSSQQNLLCNWLESENNPLNYNQIMQLLKQCKYAWNRKFSLVIIDMIAKILQDQSYYYDWQLRSLIAEIASYLDLSTIEVAIDRLNNIINQNTTWQATIDNFIERLHLRQQGLLTYLPITKPV